MMAVNISTAVDSLVELIKEKKRILLEEASKELKIPENIIMEWATFLEEEGILNIDYKFSKTFLVNKKDIKKEEQEIENILVLKDVLIRKVEYMLKYVDSQNIKPSVKIKSVSDIKRLLKDFVFTEGNITSELVYAQKIILSNVLKGLLQKIKTINSKNRDLIMDELKKVSEWKTVFEKNLRRLS